MVYLYAGKKAGYWIGRAVKEIGRDPGRLVEIDIERDEEGGDQRDMLKKGGVYAVLLRAALDGKILGVMHYIPELQVKKCSSTLPSSGCWSETCEELVTTSGKE